MGCTLRLPIRVHPEPLEGIWGWALRASAANGYPEPHWILQDVGFLPPRIQPRDEILQNLVEASGASKEQWETRIPQKRGTGNTLTTLPGIEVVPHLFQLNTARVCPTCLIEQELIPAVWQLNFWSCCPRHGTQLIDLCPDCGTRLNWKRAGVNRCSNASCRTQLSEIQCIPALQRDLALVTFVAEAIGLKGSSQRSPLTQIFGTPSPEDAIGLVAFFHLRPRKQRPAELTQFSSALILEDWPNGFHRFVDLIRNKDYTGANLRRLYPDLYEKLMIRVRYKERISENIRNIILHEFFAAAQRAPMSGVGAPYEKGQNQKQLSYINRAAAARILKLSYNAVRNLHRNGTLRGYSTTSRDGRRNYVFLNSEDVDRESRRKLLAKSQSWDNNKVKFLPYWRAADRLGLNKRNFNELVSAGLLKVEQRSCRRYVEAKAVDELCQNLACYAKKAGGSTPKSCQFIALSSVRKDYEITPAELIRDVLRNRIFPAFVDSTKIGLRGIMFDRRAVSELLRRIRQERGYINMRDVSRILLTNEIEIRRLAEHNLIKIVTEFSERKNVLIRITEVRKFLSDIAPIGLLSKYFKMNRREVRSRFLASHCEPKLGHAGHHTSSYWSWEDVDRVFGRLERSQAQRYALDLGRRGAAL